MVLSRKNQSLITESEEQTVAAGRELAATLKNGDVVSLSGPLGAGKTCFIRGIAIGLGVNRGDIKSPSFTLVNEYYGSMPLYHFDLYRLKEISELYGIGWDDYLMRDGIVVVEWGEKAGDRLPDRRIEINIKIISENKRHLELALIGQKA
ncbi:MAG: tRNA (adenosine(37)-N6)-threonylcarbamoyltransferase complex ATPase subunit type 1 TsaE [Candidatus Zixiibacteriota bacterium]|nr:MAG: tRNA (adenosine(37)-N6)-threonylcarbamoyltransferase complex ATPase subunit type 1 TsaE [candidate division Zixibacteria bacterium]